MSEASKANDVGEQPGVSVWWRVLLGLVVLIGLLVATGFVWQRVRGDRLSGRLAAAVEELDAGDPSWRLTDLVEDRDKIPEADNSALLVVDVGRRVPPPWPSSDFNLHFNSRDIPPPACLDAGQVALVEKELAPHLAALAEARKLAGMPRGRHRITLEMNPFATEATFRQDIVQVVALLRLDALLRAEQEDVGGALASCRALLNTARSVGDEPLPLAQLIRTDSVRVACATAERVLAQGEATEADLAALQKLLAVEEKHPTLVLTARGERAVLDDLFEKVEDGRIPVEVLFRDFNIRMPANPRTRLLGYSKADVRRERLQMLELMTRKVENARLPEHEQAAAERRLDAGRAAPPREKSLLWVLWALTAKGAGDACRHKTARVRCLMTLVAVERYRLAKKAWPEKLTDLVPKYLSAVPLDPFDGKPLRYRKRTDGVTVYSVGADSTDNGGRIDRGSPVKAGMDLGCELWDVKERRQPPREK
jgi:hypothetical protein